MNQVISLVKFKYLVNVTEVDDRRIKAQPVVRLDNQIGLSKFALVNEHADILAFVSKGRNLVVEYFDCLDFCAIDKSDRLTFFGVYDDCKEHDRHERCGEKNYIRLLIIEQKLDNNSSTLT